MQRRHLLQQGAALAAVLAASTALAQESYPARPVTVIVPFTPGGGSDNVARLITSKLAERTGKTFIIENRGGAGTNIGNEAAARSAPDGYTLLLGQFTLSVNPFLYSGLRYNVERDFAPVGLIASTPTVLVVPPASAIKDVKGLQREAQSRPGKLNFASGGAGTPPHLSGELFKSMAKASVVHIPYKGSGPAMTDLIGGQVDFMIDTSTAVLPQVKGHKVRAVAVAAAQRLRELPDTPTFAEQGLPGFEVLAWYGLLAPAGTPAPAVAWLNGELNKVLRDPAVRTRLEEMGAVPMGGSAADMGTFMKAQAERWGRLIKDTGIRID